MAVPNFIDQIPDYFAGELSPAERQVFEKALDKDVGLREAITIWQEVEEVLAPAPEDKLVENIARLRTASGAEPEGNGWYWKLGLPLVLLLVTVGWYFWPESTPVDPLVRAPSAVIEDSLKIRNDTLDLTPVDDDPVETSPPPLAPQTPVETPSRPLPTTEEEEVEEESSTLVFAANYDPNPLIEAEMKDQLRGGEISLELTVPGPEATLVSTNDLISIVFSGNVTTDLSQDEVTIRLLLLSNRVEDYQQSNYLATLPAELTPTENGYTLGISDTATAQPGLYYYFLEWEEEETYLKIGRLRVE